MPERLPYDEAMLFSSARLKVQDPEIKQGKVETIKVQTRLGVVERPWGVEGGFAVVYKFRTRSGQFRALRCFRVPMEPDTQFRYEQIGPYFHTHASAITAGFKYHDCGIVVKEQGKSQGLPYPIIEMDWIDGMILVDKVDELCQKRDRATLRSLSEQWVSLLSTLHKAKIAHGDLAGPNIMVRQDGRLVLIDYDGVYIPAFAGKPAVLLGQPDYQHPQMGKRKFDEHMDAFSALVIHIALLALAQRPELWDTHAVRDQGKLLDTNLLFAQKDFLDPHQSAIFRELENLGDQRIKTLVQELKRCCALSVEQVRFPFHLLDPDHEQKQMLEQLKLAITADDDEQIVKLWTPELTKYQGAQAQRKRMELAQQRVDALSQWRALLKKGSLTQMVANYDPVLDQSKGVKPVERDLLAHARAFLQAYNSHDDDALLMEANELQRLSSQTGIAFTSQENRRIAQARQRKKDIEQVRTALKSAEPATIANVYTPFQHIRRYLTQQECLVVEMASKFLQAYNKNDDDEILAAFAAIQQSTQSSQLQLSPEQKDRVEQARRRKAALAQLQSALQSKKLAAIATAYNPILDHSKEIIAEDRARIRLACRFVQARKDQHDADLVKVYDSIQSSDQRNGLLFTKEEESQVQQARQRCLVLEQFRSALKTRRPQQIADVYYHQANLPLLSTSKAISTAQRERAQLARDFVQSLQKRDEDGLLAVYEALQRPSHKDAFIFTAQEQNLIQEIRARKIALARFTQALASGIATDIDAAYKQLSLELRAQLTVEQRSKAEDAALYLHMYQQLQAAIQANNGREVRRIHRRISAHPMLQLSSDDQQYIDSLMEVEKVDQLLRVRDDRQAIKVARNLQRQRGNSVDEMRLQLSGAARRFIKTCELQDVSAFIQQARHRHCLVVSWRWPEEDQVRDAIVIYSPYQVPPSFQELQEVTYPYKFVIRRVHERDKMEELPLERNYTSLYLRICTLMRDEWENPAARNKDGQFKHYLSTGITGQAHLRGHRASTGRSL